MSSSSNWAYSDVIKEHFQNPRNILKDEQAFKADGVGTVGNVKCGDQMRMFIRVDSKDQVIADCKWQTYGCASAIASTSILSEIVIGLPLQEAYTLKPKDIAEKLGGLPENKIHCSVLGDKALRAAIEDYYEKSGQLEEIEREKDRLVCQCMNVTEGQIVSAIEAGAASYLELQEHTKLGTVCGQCKEEAQQLLEYHLEHNH
jgi:nitrogen fixation protein NifU and related proteins